MRQLTITLVLAAALVLAPAALAADVERVSLTDLVSDWFQVTWGAVADAAVDSAAELPQAIFGASESEVQDDETADDEEPPVDGSYGPIIIPGA